MFVAQGTVYLQDKSSSENTLVSVVLDGTGVNFDMSMKVQGNESLDKFENM